MKGPEEMLEGKGVINFGDYFTGAYNATTHQIVTSTTCDLLQVIVCQSSCQKEEKAMMVGRRVKRHL